jgi:hypothetical protein
MSTTDWTVNQLGDEWNVVEWNDHFDPEVRPKSSSSASGQARACPSYFFAARRPACRRGKFTSVSIRRDAPLCWHASS